MIRRPAITLPCDFEDSEKTKTSEYTNTQFDIFKCIKYKVQNSRTYNLWRATSKERLCYLLNNS